MSDSVLGRGLDSLIPRKRPLTPPLAMSSYDSTSSTTGVLEVPINDIIANDYQPRAEFDDEGLAELADSIREFGVIQPLVVNREGAQYRLIAGERRLRASKLVGLLVVPVVVRSAGDEERLAVAVIENVQRVDLNPIELALGYKRLMEEFNMNQDQIAKKLGKGRPSITNTLRLLTVAPEVQEALFDKRISKEHAKTLAGIHDHDEQRSWLKRILEEKLDKTEFNKLRGRVNDAKPIRRSVEKFDPAVASKEELLREHFGTKVIIDRRAGFGTVTIHFYSDEELRNLIYKMIGE